MFTGIIEGVGELKQQEENRYTFSHPFGEAFALGESVAINGMCATVLSGDEKVFTVEIMQESRDRTTFGSILPGTEVNLERSAIIGQRNSGHHVTGHIDEVGTIQKLQKEGDYWRICIGISSKNNPLIVEKGSVAVDGISLTVAAEGDGWFEVGIITHTWEYTALHTKKEGDGVNIEYDILGKYVIKAQ